MASSVERTIESVRSSQMLRLLYIGFLALLRQVPIILIHELVSEREARQAEAVADISSKWGAAQSVTGPVLVLPYTHRFTERSPDGVDSRMSQARSAVFLPEQLNVKGTMTTESRKRGIFSVPVYNAGVTIEGQFARPDLLQLGIEPATVEWARAFLAVGIADTRAIQQETSVNWNGQQVAFLPGTQSFTQIGNGIHAPVSISAATGQVAFSFPISLNGSVSARFAPFGQNTSVALTANSGHPSFQGNWLPTERTINNEGFTANWSIPFLGRGYPQSWTTDTDMRANVEASRFGVDLVNPVDQYRMSQRSVKYALLFILLTFAAVWLMEVLVAVRVHSIQYLMLGGALVLFYLLELSLSEHIGFAAAYLIASLSVIAMVGGYGMAVLGRTSRAAAVAAGVAVLYGYLYLLLMNEDYALLAGSIGLFVVLAAIMYATRRVDWYAIGKGWRE
jgi:inner membrane protein